MDTLEMAQPTGCIQDKPTTTTVELAGKPINILAISRQTHIDQSYLCRILRGKKAPTLETALKIAGALGMPVEELYIAIRDRKNRIELERAHLGIKYFERVAGEDMEDLDKLRKGKVPQPRLPGTRLK